MLIYNIIQTVEAIYESIKGYDGINVIYDMEHVLVLHFMDD